MLTLRASLLALTLPLVAACSSGSNDGPDMAVSMTPPSDAMLLASRPYTPIVPAGYTASKAYPLMIVLAGFGDLGSDISQYLGMTQLAADKGAFLVTPDADAPNLRFSWDPDPVHYPYFDVEYLRAIIHDVEKKYSIDRGQVFIAGHSLGAHMAHRMACDDSEDVIAIMSLAGQVTQTPSQCAPTQAVSVVQVHGTSDAVIGYNGDLQNIPPDPSIPSAHQTVAVWARNDHCTGPIALTGVTLDLDSSLPGNETTVEAYSGCPAAGDVDAGTARNIGVELWSIQKGMHIPMLTPGFAPLVWTFWQAHAGS